VGTRDLCLTIGVQDSGSGVARIRIGLDGRMDAAAWEDFSSYAASNMVFPGRAKIVYRLPEADGAYDVCIQVKDWAGNVAALVIPVVKDEQAPQADEPAIVAGTFTRDGISCIFAPDVTVSVSASDSGAGISAYRLGPSWQMLTPWQELSSPQAIVSATVPYRLIPGDGLRRICVQFRDATGKITTAASPVYLLTAPPHRPVVALWAGRPEGSPPDAPLTATWGAPEDPVGISAYQVQISRSQDFEAGTPLL